MATRTEEEKVSRAPIIVKITGQDYKVAPLVRKEARAWREKVVVLMGAIISTQDENPTSLVGAFQASVTRAMLDAPDKLGELVTAFAPNLTTEVLDRATDEEIGVAFTQIFQLAFPHLAELGRLTQMARTSGLSQ